MRIISIVSFQINKCGVVVITLAMIINYNGNHFDYICFSICNTRFYNLNL